MEIVRQALPEPDPRKPRVAIRVDRLKLQKRRWRGMAEDGMEFGFELDDPLTNGTPVFQSTHVYVVEQTAEPVLEVPLPANAADVARLAWLIGNLHFPVQILSDRLRVADDPALRQMLEQGRVAFHGIGAVFQPLAGGHHH